MVSLRALGALTMVASAALIAPTQAATTTPSLMDLPGPYAQLIQGFDANGLISYSVYPALNTSAGSLGWEVSVFTDDSTPTNPDATHVCSGSIELPASAFTVAPDLSTADLTLAGGAATVPVTCYAPGTSAPGTATIYATHWAATAAPTTTLAGVSRPAAPSSPVTGVTMQLGQVGISFESTTTSQLLYQLEVAACPVYDALYHFCRV